MRARTLLVDWGTTSFRLWAVDADGAILAERRSGEGLTSTGDFDAVLESHAAALGVGIDVPVRLPRPRSQLETREEPEFLRLRRELFDFIRESEA